MQALLYLYSISFFFLLKRHTVDSVYSRFGLIFFIVNILVILGGLFGFYVLSGVKCTEDVTY